MEVLDQVKERVETLVNDVKENIPSDLSNAQGKAEEVYGKVVDNTQSVFGALKNELSTQSGTLKTYQERISAKMNKHFNREELIADVKEEFQFFTGEVKDSVERIKTAITK